MAIYHFSAQIIGRSNGRSSVAAAAYRSGDVLLDEQTGTECRYQRRQERVAHSEIIAPREAPAWTTDRGSLWNAVERAERRKDAQLAREFEVSLPVELTEPQRLALVRDWARDQLVSHGLVVDICHHRDKADRNPHVHIMATTRPIEGDGFGGKARHLNDREWIATWRRSWAEYANDALERAGHRAKIDHRSFADQGIDREPTIKEGYAARRRAAAGLHADRCAENRAIRARNAARSADTALQVQVQPEVVPAPPAAPERVLEGVLTVTPIAQPPGPVATPPFRPAPAKTQRPDRRDLGRRIFEMILTPGRAVVAPFKALADLRANKKRQEREAADARRAAIQAEQARILRAWQQVLQDDPKVLKAYIDRDRDRHQGPERFAYCVDLKRAGLPMPPPDLMPTIFVMAGTIQHERWLDSGRQSSTRTPTAEPSQGRQTGITYTTRPRPGPGKGIGD